MELRKYKNCIREVYIVYTIGGEFVLSLRRLISHFPRAFGSRSRSAPPAGHELTKTPGVDWVQSRQRKLVKVLYREASLGDKFAVSHR